MPGTRLSRVAVATPSGVLAIDIGGTKIAGAVVDRRGRIVRHVALPVDCGRPGGAIRQCLDLARILAAPHNPQAAFAAAGIAVPGLVRPSGDAWAPNLAWTRMPVARRLSRALAMPIVVESDRNASVLGEAWTGAARGRRHVVAVVVGTGIGAGILSDGRLVRGAHELSGCLGWLVVADRHFMDRERTGALESIAAGPGIERAAHGLRADRRRAGGEPASALDTPRRARTEEQEGQTAFELAARARAGDAGALTLFREAGRHLGLAVGNIISTLDPEVVVIGGGLAGAADLFLPALREAALGTCQPIAARRVRIVVSRLGNRANLLGVARLAWTVANRESRAATRKPSRITP
jgi:glucokinase